MCAASERMANDPDNIPPTISPIKKIRAIILAMNNFTRTPKKD